jgi:zinc protease
LNNSIARTVLGNGLTVITRESHKVPIASFWVWYRVGSRNEAAGTTGISHWVEHMMFKGTPTLSKGDIFRRVNANGGVLNGFTWLDYTAYFETLPSQRLDLALEIESDRMVNSLFEADEVESERTVIISEREGSENSPTFLLGEEIGAAAFQSHPYGHSVIGWKSDLRSITRDDLFNHYQTYYTPNNAIVVVVGDFDTESLLGRVEERFGRIPSGPPVPSVRPIEPPQRGERRVTVRRPAGVPHFEVAYHSPAISNPDAYSVMVLDAVLSGGKPMGMFGSRGARMGRSSRLYRALVDGGLASGVGSSFAATRDPYLFGIEATPRPGVSLEDVERAIFQEVENVQKFGVSREEVGRAMKQVKAQFVYASESVTDQSYWLGAMEVLDSYETYGKIVERLEQVSPEDIKRVAEEYLTESNRIVGWLVPTETAGADISPQASAIGQAYFYSGPGRWSVPSGSAAPALSLPIHREELDNGIVVLAVQDTTTPQVIVRASLMAGSIFDSEEKSGTARFAAPMLMRGTGNHTFQELSEETDGLGMALTVDAGRLTAQIGVRCLKEDFGRGMELMAEVLRGPVFPPEEIEKLRGQIISGLREQESSARAVAERRFLKELYPPGHAYHLWPLGTQETVSAITREDLEGFYRQHYRPDTLVVAVVGDSPVEHAVEEVRRVLGDWQPSGAPPEFRVDPVDLPARASHDEVVPGKFQSEIVMGLPAISRKDPEYYAMRLGNLILGELGLSGRLGASIRERQGLAYHVSSDAQAGVGPSPWAVRAGVNPANVDRAIEAALQEVGRWREELVSAEELEDAKSFLVGSLPIALETNDGVARTILDIEFYELGLDYLQRYPGIIQSISAEEIRDAVRRWIHPEHMVTIVAGPPRQ